jgi:plastocyanin
MRTAVLEILLIAFAIGIAACNRPNNSEPQPTVRKAIPRRSIDPATAATVSGTVNFAGTTPASQKIDMSMDPACKAQDVIFKPIEVTDGHLANAFVYIKAGLPEAHWDPPTADAVIDQDGCRYHPHVLAVMTGQPVKIMNRDSTTHNIHPMPQIKGNREWNQSQPPEADPIIKTFNSQELMIPIKCNQHPWMKMYLNVMSHPFFAVTGKDGRFEIRGLPPGTYTLAVVHEKLGELTQQLTVGPKENKAVDFGYSSASVQ